MNAGLLGETAAKVMDALGARDGELVAVLIVAVVDEPPDGDDAGTFTRVESSCERVHEQLGLLYQAIRVVESGERPDDET